MKYKEKKEENKEQREIFKNYGAIPKSSSSSEGLRRRKEETSRNIEIIMAVNSSVLRTGIKSQIYKLRDPHPG